MPHSIWTALHPRRQTTSGKCSAPSSPISGGPTTVRSTGSCSRVGGRLGQIKTDETRRSSEAAHISGVLMRTIMVSDHHGMRRPLFIWVAGSDALCRPPYGNFIRGVRHSDRMRHWQCQCTCHYGHMWRVFDNEAAEPGFQPARALAPSLCSHFY